MKIKLIVIAAALCVLLTGCAAQMQKQQNDTISSTVTEENENPVVSDIEIEDNENPVLSDIKIEKSETIIEDVSGSMPELTDLYKCAAVLSSKYGVNIFIGDTIPDTIGAVPYTEHDDIQNCLSAIDSILGCYPQGFFKNFTYGDYDRIHLYLSTGSTAGAYWPDGSKLCINIDPDAFFANTDYFNYTLHHEICHMIDYRMQFAENGKYPSIDEEKWNSFNPQGFEYVGNNYEDQMALYDTCYEYFSDSYGTCSPFEDRATLFGTAMAYYQNSEYGIGCLEMPHCREKYSYFCSCIRNEFSFDNLSDLLPWETAISQSE